MDEADLGLSFDMQEELTDAEKIVRPLAHAHGRTRVSPSANQSTPPAFTAAHVSPSANQSTSPAPRLFTAAHVSPSASANPVVNGSSALRKQRRAATML